MLSQAEPPYLMSFGTGGAHVNESINLAMARLAGTPWETLAAGTDFFAARKEASARRLQRELTHRLRKLNEAELQLLVEGDRAERAALLWAAICRTYHFIAEWAQEVLNERALNLRPEVGYPDFDRFLRDKENGAPELARLTASTRAKLRAVLFRLMRETGVTSGDGEILAGRPPLRVQALLRADELRFFPGAEL